MFSFAINKNEIIMTEFETVTSGSVNVYECNFNFSDDWEGLAKTVTFRAGYTKISVLLDNTNKCSIPWEVLAKDAVQLYCGVRGTVTPSDEEEEAIIPTMYCLLGTIRKGTELGDNAAPPEPSVVDQIMNRIEALDTGKQDKLTGTQGQIVGFDANGNAVAQDNESPVYTAGDNISISGNVISAAMYDDTSIKSDISNLNTGKQDKLTAGDNISISGNVISADMYDDTEVIAAISSLDADKQNKLSGTAGQVVGFDTNGNAVAQDGGADGVTFTPNVSTSGMISWTNDGGRENPEPVDITGPAGAAAGFGTVTATVTNTTGTPSVTVKASGDNTAKNFDFAFSGLKGESGSPASIPAYSVEKLTLASYTNSAAEYAIKKDGVALTPNIIIPRHGAYINDVAPSFYHIDIPSGRAFSDYSVCKFSVNWGFDVYIANGTVYDFRLYPKTNSQYTINLSEATSSTKLSNMKLELSSGDISMSTYQSIGKIFLLEANSNSFKINNTATNKLYLYCKIYDNSSMFYSKFALEFLPLDSNPSNTMYLGSNANCNLIQLS